MTFNFTDLYLDDELPEQFKQQTINRDKLETFHDLVNGKISALETDNSWQGLKYLDSEVILNAPEGYFNNLVDFMVNLLPQCQGLIAGKGLSELVNNCFNKPDDEKLLDSVYNEVKGIIFPLLVNLPFAGVKRKLFTPMLFNEMLGLSLLDPLYRDATITEIIANGPYDIQIQRAGSIQRVKSLQFQSPDHLQRLIDKLYTPLNKQVSRITPQVQGRLHDFSRLYANDRSICPTGPTLNIRRHKERYIHPEQYLTWESCNQEMLTDLGNYIYNGANYVVVGGTGSGKTTLLSSLTGFIPNNQRILTLEHNLEMKPHPGKLLVCPQECIPARKDVPGDQGVTMRDLVKGALQQLPDWIIVGEVTDGSAYDMVQALSTGHSGGSTVHADDTEDAIGRLSSLVSQGGVMTGSEEALPLIGAAIDLLIVTKRFFQDGSRKITEIYELGNLPVKNPSGAGLTLPVRPLWKLVDDGVDSEGKVLCHWEKQNGISDKLKNKLHLALSEPLEWKDLQQLADC